MHYLIEKDITALNSYIINKYTVFMSIIIFLELNGYKFTVSKKELVNYTVKLVTDDIAIWIRGIVSYLDEIVLILIDDHNH